MDKRKLRRWFKKLAWYESDDMLYRREYYHYRNTFRALNELEVRKLVSELADLYGLPLPRQYYSYSIERMNGSYLGAFKVKRNGEAWIHYRLASEYVPVFQLWGTDTRCKQWRLHVYHLPKGTTLSSVVLHEFAHYLCAEWWGHSRHDAIFISVVEALESWYKSKRRKGGVKLRVRKFATGKYEGNS